MVDGIIFYCDPFRSSQRAQTEKRNPPSEPRVTYSSHAIQQGNFYGATDYTGYWRNRKRASLARTRYWDRNPDTPFRYGVVGNISACHADARGSIPRFGDFFLLFLFRTYATLAAGQHGLRRKFRVPRTNPKICKKRRKKAKKFAFSPNRKTRAESHAIDATRHLYTLQYPVWNLSRLQMIHGSSNLALLCAPRKCVWSWPEGYRNFNR